MDGVDGFVSIVIQQELERIKYMVRSYLRTRLRKIECYCTFLLLDPAERDKMSDDELRYATKFRDLVSQYHTESFLNELPETLRSLDEPQMSILLNFSQQARS
ncbi:hypothetical protein EDD86DRAFT_211879 [Gorgonomyces haynaldii]|nr:hypothetical protein EDD86DRAFT_211879 [Gorgonomyces haynaldii]